MTHPLEFHPALNPGFAIALAGGISAQPSPEFRRSRYATDEVDEFHRPPLVPGKRSVYGDNVLTPQLYAKVMAVVETDSTSSLDGVEWLGTVQTNGLPDRIKFAIFQVAQFEKSGQGKVAARVILRFVEQNFASRDLIAVSNFLQALDASALSPWSIVAVLRSTFRARHVMPGWQAFLDQARAELSLRQEPVEKILYGLD